MQRIRILAANAGELDDRLGEAIAAHSPDIVALAGIAPAQALRIAGPRAMRAATQDWNDEIGGLAILWKASLAVASLDRFDFGQRREPSGALRISFPLDGRYVAVYCSKLSSDPAAVAGQQARLAALIDSARTPTLAACEGVVTRDGERWSRCVDAWTIAKRRVITLAASDDVGFAAHRAFGLAPESASVDRRSQAGPLWHCSEEFSVFETRSIALSGTPEHLVRTATLSLRASAADENVAIAL
jgi:hypothetical protein